MKLLNKIVVVRYLLLMVCLTSILLVGCSQQAEDQYFVDTTSAVDKTLPNEATAIVTEPTQTVQSEPGAVVITLINEYGNTGNNIANSAYVAQQGDYLFYSNTADNFSLYRMKTDGSEKVKLCDGLVHNINVIGDWIYFTKDSNNMYYGNLYKIRLDGSQETELTNSEVSDVNVTGDWIYYCDEVDYHLYKMRTNGSEVTQFKVQPYCIIVIGDWIYYTRDGVHKIKTDGTEQTVVTSEIISESYLGMENGWIYYLPVNENNCIFKIKTDGTERTKVNSVESTPFNVSAGWIYYAYYEKDQNMACLYKIRTDGSECTKLNDEGVTAINVFGDWVYYMSQSTLYRIRTDGTENQGFN